MSSPGPNGPSAAAVTCQGETATIVGTAGPDTINGTPAADVIHGLGGADVISGFGGDDVICGGAGSDVIDGQSGADTLLGGAGTDTLRGGDGGDLLRGGPGSDTVRGGGGVDAVYGDAGADHLFGVAGADSLHGGDGGDTLDGGLGDDMLAGNLGPDTAFGRGGDDTLLGGPGDDVLSGGLQTDWCDGAGGEDFADTSCETILDAELAVPGPDFPVGPTDWDALVDVSERTTITSGTHVIENVRYLDGLVIEGSATSVTLRNCVVVSPGSFWTIFVDDGATLVMEDCQIGQDTDSAGERGVGGDNVTLRRVKIVGHVDGIKAGSDSLYEQVWITDLRNVNGVGHLDGIQADGGSSNWTVRYSRIEPDGIPGEHANSAITIKSDLGPISDVLVEYSVVDDGNYTIDTSKGTNYPYPTGVVIQHTGFGRDYLYGVLLDSGNVVTWIGNYRTDTGECIDDSGDVIPGTCS